MRFSIFMICTIMLSGCMLRPTQADLANADYGDLPHNFKEIVQAYFSKTLVDPYSAQYSEWKTPTKGYQGSKLSGVKYGFFTCVDVNAKNRMGGYSGTSQYIFLIHNGNIIYSDGGYEGNGAISREIASTCAGFGSAIW